MRTVGHDGELLCVGGKGGTKGRRRETKETKGDEGDEGDTAVCMGPQQTDVDSLQMRLLTAKSDCSATTRKVPAVNGRTPKALEGEFTQRSPLTA